MLEMSLGFNYSKLINKFAITFQQLIPLSRCIPRQLERNLNNNKKMFPK